MPPRSKLVVPGPSDADLCARVQAGDTTAADVLLKRHEKLIWRQIHKLKLPDWIDKDDLFQAGQLALWHAAAKWQAGRGAKFTTYAQPAIWNAVVGAARKEQKKASSLDSRPFDPDGNDVLNALVAPEPVEQDPAVTKWLRELSPALRRVVVLHFGIEGQPMRWGEIATATGMSIVVAKRALELALNAA